MSRISITSFGISIFVASVVACSSSSSTPSATGDADAAVSETDAGETTTDGSASGGCSTALTQLLLPIEKTSTAEVSVVSESDGAKLIYVDGSAGGQPNAAKNPRVYIDLAAAKRVDLTDTAARTSIAWDLSIKRTVIFTNGGDGGPGQGSAASVNKKFANVTADDADKAKLKAESFVDEECNAKKDPIGAPLTTFSSWYDYDQATNIPTPFPITYIVKSANGTRYKLAIESYAASPDGGVREATGYFLIRVAPL